MMRRRQRDQGDGITLFPFLAVLICTVGSLIVLLVVVVQQAKANANQVAEHKRIAEEEYAAQTNSVETDIQDLAWRIEVLQSSKETTEQQLQRQNEELSYLEDEIRRLRDQLERAALQAEDIETLAASDSALMTEHQQRVAELREEIEAAKVKLAAARDALDDEETSYALVAYSGPNGTRRRPVFIECRQDRVIFQPEGIELTGEDFAEPLTDDNPLAAALRAQREYLSDASGHRGEAPYPLIVVRPDGAAAYSATRAAMKAWDAEFGYELVDESVKLKYPKPDPSLVASIELAVKEARARRKMYQAIAPARFGRREAPVLTASRNGGFVSSGNGRQGSDTGAGGIAEGGRSAFGGTEGNRYMTADSSATVGNGGDGLGAGGSEGQRGGDAPGGSSNSGGSTDSGGTAQGRDGARAIEGPDDRAGQYADGLGGPGAGPSNGFPRSNGRDGQDDSSKAGASGSRGPGNALAMSGGGPSRSGASGQAGGAAGMSAGSAAGGSAAGGSAVGTAGPGRAGMAAPSEASMANARGRDWALRDRAQGATGITRPISLVCHPDRIVLLPENRYNGRTYEVQVNQRLRSNIDELVSLVWQRMDSWGIAGNRMYWKPVLEVHVQPEAEQRFVELTALLENSGVVVKRKR